MLQFDDYFDEEEDATFGDANADDADLQPPEFERRLGPPLDEIAESVPREGWSLERLTDCVRKHALLGAEHAWFAGTAARLIQNLLGPGKFDSYHQNHLKGIASKSTYDNWMMVAKYLTLAEVRGKSLRQAMLDARKKKNGATEDAQQKKSTDNDKVRSRFAAHLKSLDKLSSKLTGDKSSFIESLNALLIKLEIE